MQPAAMLRQNSRMRSDVVRLFQTLPHPCGYFSERTAQNLVIDPSSPELRQLYDFGLQCGYRRAGEHVYVPHCSGCRACIPCRIPVQRFVADRSQRRCLTGNGDLQLKVLPVGFSEERFELYRRYLQWRHPNGGMDDARPEDFTRFLYTAWSPTRFLEMRLDSRLVGVAVTDFCTTGLSAVYTFYDPDLSARGLGTFAILKQIQIAREHDVEHLYLGFWIDAHPKMGYKSRFRPIETLRNGHWQMEPHIRSGN